MQIALRPEQEMFVLEKVSQGVYESPEELFALAFQLLEEYELQQREYEKKQQRIIKLRQEILEGMEDIRQGRFVDGEVVFQQLEEKLESMKQR
ncbi:MAG: type II toxin-antitoxin system ParD family antitoxin [Coleofasciculaceae cyanobacterium SM2_1_6]|nr:type II toxin-antitoxin system ParD family antitoxin [Coleofasciculaceae cyanobacterium SM2_1_6]